MDLFEFQYIIYLRNENNMTLKGASIFKVNIV
jgi:hypothetical protein